MAEKSDKQSDDLLKEILEATIANTEKDIIATKLHIEFFTKWYDDLEKQEGADKEKVAQARLQEVVGRKNVLAQKESFLEFAKEKLNG